MDKYGYAVDLGTTTIDCALVDVTTGNIVAEESTKNRQSLYGSDVINRIYNAGKTKETADKMKVLVCEDIASLLDKMLAETHKACNESDGFSADYKAVSNIVISGNTTMISILLGVDVTSLGKAPFQPVLKGNVTVNAGALFGENTCLDCMVTLTGCASAFLGGDILSGITYLDRTYHAFFQKTKNTMLIDLGTNGEMVLNAKGRLYGASTACGPAFEGCTRRQGIHGATTIDAIALLIKTKNLSKDGVLADAYLEKGIYINGVRLDMNIIRQILMAKAAIYSGIAALCKRADITLDEIDEVYLAGGFGFYLDLGNAYLIGLLPKEFQGKITICGNTSLKGACMMVLDETAIEKMESLTKDAITIVQLAEDDTYKRLLIETMRFG